MSGERIRFIHTADWHLEQPPGGLAEIPDHLRDLLIDAPYVAARQIFEAAVLEQVDFVVIAGDVADIARAGPRAIAFLEEQFQLLEERQIRVYWAGGKADVTDQWTRQLQVPANVHFFANDHIESVTHLRKGSPLVTLIGASWNGSPRFSVSRYLSSATGDKASDLPTVAVAYGLPDEQSPATASDDPTKSAPPIDYWALGGKHQRRQRANSFLVHCGTPQGRSPLEPGVQGCTLVEINQQRQVRTKLIPTDALRYQNVEFSVTGRLNEDELVEQLRQQIEEARGEADHRPVLLSCRVHGFEEAQSSTPAAMMAGQLRTQFNERYGKATPPMWTCRVEIEPPDVLPDQWYQEATILGDFLRSVRDDDDDDQTLDDLERYLSERQQASSLSTAIRLEHEGTRERVLRKSALLGCELLRGKRAVDDRSVAQPEEYVL